MNEFVATLICFLWIMKVSRNSNSAVIQFVVERERWLTLTNYKLILRGSWGLKHQKNPIVVVVFVFVSMNHLCKISVSHRLTTYLLDWFIIEHIWKQRKLCRFQVSKLIFNNVHSTLKRALSVFICRIPLFGLKRESFEVKKKKRNNSTAYRV